MSDLKAQLEITADAGGVETGVTRAKRSLADLGATGAAAGKQVSTALAGAGDGGAAAAEKVDAAATKMTDSVARTEAASKRARKALSDIGEGGAEAATRTEAATRSISQALKTAGATGAGSRSATPLDGAGAAAQAEAAKIERAQRSIIGSIERTTAVLEAGARGTSEYYAVLAKQRGVDPAALQPYLAALDAANGKTKQVGVSAAQTAAALRGVPAQFTDIVTSLQGGQAPLTVLLQQGGQLKDTFGGVGAAARGLGGFVLSLVTPLTAAGAALAALLLAYKQGQDESDAFARALILTGNAAGTTTGQLADSARSVSATVGTVGKAAEVLGQLASAGNIDSSGFEAYAAAAIKLEKVTGIATSETVKNFSDLGKAPLSASLKLNESLNFLTATTYTQIKALTDQGRTNDAAAVAQKAYADAVTGQAAAIEARLGTLERAWNAVGGGAKAAWDRMLDVGRQDTLGGQISAAQKRVDELAAMQARGGRRGLFGEQLDTGADQDLSLARGELFGLQTKRDAEALAAKQQADAAAMVKARALFDDAGKQYLSGLQQLNQQIDQARNTGKSAGATPLEIEVRVAAIRFKFDLAQYEADAGLKTAIGKAAADAEIRQQDAAQARLESLRTLGAVSERAAAESSLTIERAKLASQRTLIEQQIEIERKRPLPVDDKAAATAQQAKLAGLRADLAAVKSQIQQAPTLTGFKVDAIDLSALRESAAEYARLIGQADDLTQQHSQSIAQGLAQLITEPLARARAEADLTAQGIERTTAKLALALRSQIDVLRGQGTDAAQAQADVLQARLDQVTSRGSSAAQQARGRPDIEAIQRGIEQTDDLAQQHARSISSALAQLIVDPLDRARAEADLAAQDIEAKTEKIRKALQAQIDLLRQRDDLPGEADALQRRLDQVTAQGGTDAKLTRGKPGQDFLAQYLAKDPSTDLASGFDAASQSMGAFVKVFGQLLDTQQAYNKARSVEGATAEQIAAIESKRTAEQLSGYASLAGAAKGLLKERTTGYKLLAGAEKGLRVLELANAVQVAATKIGLMGTVAATKVATDTTMAASDTARAGVEQGNSLATTAVKGVEAVINAIRSLPFPLNLAAGAATAAAVASLGIAIGGGFSSGSAHAPTNDGSGTVLGDSSAKSESISKSIDALADIDTITMRHSAGMLAALQSIDANIGGLASLLVRSGDLSPDALRTPMGFEQNLLGNVVGSTFNALTLNLVPAIGNALGNLFGSKTSVDAQGILGGPQSLGSIRKNGFDASLFADITTKDKFLGLTTNTTTSTQLTAASADTKRQFALILGSFGDAVREAGAGLGVNLDTVSRRLDSFVVDIGKIDLQGLSGTQISERLSAVFGAAGDKIAHAVLPGLEGFQRVGEGYLETVTRVASSIEVATAALDRLGVATADYTTLANKQGDIAAELVRQSITGAEAGTAVGQIIATLSGTAGDLADTYASLLDIRASLRGIGIDGEAVSSALIRGAGGLSQLQSGLADFESKFLGPAEQNSLKLQRLTTAFGNLGQAVPSSAEAFKSLVRGVDTSTDAGQKLLGGLLSLSGGFADLLDSVKNAGSGIADEIARIRGITADGGDASLAQLKARFAISTAQARAGDQAAIDALPKASQELLAAAKTQLDGQDALARLQAQTLASLEQTLTVVRGATTVADTSAAAAGSLATAGAAVQAATTTAAVVLTGPAQVPAVSPSAGTQADVAAAVKALQTELANLRSEQQIVGATLASYTRQTADLLERCIDGPSALRTTTAA
jgi:phage-related minor tail protein